MHCIPERLMPPPQYQEMAQAIVANGQGIHEFLNACEGCGLPVEDRRTTLNEHIDFAKNFLKHFYPSNVSD